MSTWTLSHTYIYTYSTLYYIYQCTPISPGMHLHKLHMYVYQLLLIKLHKAFGVEIQTSLSVTAEVTVEIQT